MDFKLSKELHNIKSNNKIIQLLNFTQNHCIQIKNTILPNYPEPGEPHCRVQILKLKSIQSYSCIILTTLNNSRFSFSNLVGNIYIYYVLHRIFST